MAFHEVRFPDDVSYGSRSGEGFLTNVIVTDSGDEQRVARWNNPRRRYTVGYDIKELADINTVRNFFIARQGAAHGFRYKDWMDFTTAADHRSAPSSNDVSLGTGDGTTNQWQLKKIYTSGPTTRTRNITKPVAGTVKIRINGVEQTEGVGFTVNTTTGIVTATVPSGQEIKGGCELDVPVRFAESADALLSASIDDYDNGSFPGVELVEVRDTTPVNDQYLFGGALEQNMAANLQLAANSGKVIVLNPTAAGLAVLLPVKTDIPAGGEIFFIFNANGTNTLAIKDDAGTTMMVALGTNTGIGVFLSINDAGTTRTWYLL
jgi:uncharacterized protein (TIGR02217 family)